MRRRKEKTVFVDIRFESFYIISDWKDFCSKSVPHMNSTAKEQVLSIMEYMIHWSIDHKRMYLSRKTSAF